MQKLYLGILIPLVMDFSGGFREEFIKSSFENNSCHTRECLVELSVSNKYNLEKKSDLYSFYFSEGNYFLSDFQKEYLENFKTLNGEISFFITGYTDGCGSSDDNIELAKLRANEIAYQIKKYFPNSKINIAVASEVSNLHNPDARKVDLYFSQIEISNIEQNKYESDFYLIDGSGSMKGKYQKWMNIISYAKKKNSRIFLSTTQFYQNGISWFGIKPYGDTEIWHSYWKILDKMRFGQRLIIISDFQPTYPLSREEFEALDNKVRRLGINVTAIKT